MYKKKRIGAKGHSSKGRKILALFLLGLVACLGTIVVTRVAKNPNVTALFYTPDSPRAPKATSEFSPAKQKRPIYPYSVIPGGVRDREELASSAQSDPVVAAHFADFNIRKAKLVKAEETQFVHVSYRLQNRVYWTAKKVKLPKGETLITDGKETARTRCGNRVSALPQDPVSEKEPPIEDLDTQLVEKVDTVQLETFVDTPWEPAKIAPLAPVVPIPSPALITPYVPPKPATILPRYYHPPRFRIPLVPVSEPGSLILLISGLTVLVAVRITWKK